MRIIGWRLLQGAGVLALLAGIAGIAVFGPDSRFVSGPHPIETEGSAIVTRPGVIAWKDVQIEVLAEVPGDKPVFVGLGNSVDVMSYVEGTERLEVISFEPPWSVETSAAQGGPALPASPTAMDWWIAGEGGLGGALLQARLPDESVSVAVLSVGDANLRGLTLSTAYGIEGIFARSIGLILLGGAVVMLVHLLLRREPGEDEQVVYVVVEEDGSEREISAEELEALGEVEIIEETEVPPGERR
ncbi:hypothetical protein BHE97_05450 [Aeromicrobium sp. PE09-221]|uniref:hypothetical protein n=1 Tax=Aeromicrobium sp. PE09-221 TaxID=1898043 RepID=UPI000B3EAC00|nr:hypothetical protein [Aeromicrobium sp. PE09-221]OUZ11281.1 hypothetical protein BHE97_05450 [Aeromicrobium sp. PE09-221]